MKVIGQVYTLAASQEGKNPLYPLDTSLDRLQSQSAENWIPGLSAHFQTKLSRLSGVSKTS